MERDPKGACFCSSRSPLPSQNVLEIPEMALPLQNEPHTKSEGTRRTKKHCSLRHPSGLIGRARDSWSWGCCKFGQRIQEGCCVLNYLQEGTISKSLAQRSTFLPRWVPPPWLSWASGPWCWWHSSSRDLRETLAAAEPPSCSFPPCCHQQWCHRQLRFKTGEPSVSLHPLKSLVDFL